MKIKEFSFHPIAGCFIILLALDLLEKNMVLAETPLERLEQQIRGQVSPSQENPPSRGFSAVPPPPVEHPVYKPSNSLSSAAPTLDKAGAVDRPAPGYLGVVADDRNDRGRGVRILEVRPGSPAQKAGLRKQDLITALAAVRVRQLSEMTDILRLYQAGDVVVFEILRDARPLKTQVVLGSRPGASPGAAQASEIIPLPQGELILPEPSSGQMFPAGEPRRQTESEKIEMLQKRIAELERRVADLERALSKAERNK
jgi:hypothetical protein